VPVHECSYWSIETADWSVDEDGGTLLLTPPDDSAVLRIDTVGAWAPGWNEMLAEARRRAPKDAIIAEVSWGSFAGLRYEGCDADGGFFRTWMLTLGELYLLVSYSCEQCHRGRDLALVDRLLSTLADRRA
jgi:hypothetical protein